MPMFSSDFFSGSKPIAIVIGGGNFIGVKVCEALLKKNVKVICLEDTEFIHVENVSQLTLDKNFTFIQHSFLKKIPEAIEKVNYVVQIAGIESLSISEKPSYKILELNSASVKKSLRFAKNKNSKFLLVSSVSAGLSSSRNDAQSDEVSPGEIKKFAENIVLQYGKEYSVDVRIARLGDVYGPNMPLNGNNILSNLIKDSLYKKVLIAKAGEYLYPIYTSDVVDGIVKSLFSSGTKNKIITIADKIISSQNFANILEGESFQNDNEKTEGVLLSQNIISWKPKVSLKQGIKDTLIWFSQNQMSLPKNGIISQTGSKKTKESAFITQANIVDFRKIISDLKNSFTKNRGYGEIRTEKKKEIVNPYWVFTTLSVLLVLFWLFLFPFCANLVGLGGLYLTEKSLNIGDTKNINVWSRQAEFWFGVAESGFGRWGQIPLLGKKGRELAQESNVLKEFTKTTTTAGFIITQLKGLSAGVIGEPTPDTFTINQKLPTELEKIQQQLSFLDAEVNNSTAFSKNSLVYKKLKQIKFSDYRKSAEGLNNLLPIIPEILGQNSKKTYLILFQDSNELRPAGGVISSYGLATFEKGKLINIEIQDVETADSQLKGHVEPPQQIRQFLNEGNWYLKDSNWSPDFSTSAQKAAWFLEKEIGQKVDGVIAMDLVAINSLLKYVELDKTQGQTENAAIFSEGVRQELQAKLLSKSDKNISLFARAVAESLAERHVSIWTTNAQVNSILKRMEWDGSLVDPSCPDSGNNCLKDYLQVVESNVGINKSNKDIVRSFNIQINVDEKSIQHKLTIHYDNWSANSNIDYKNYLRIYAQKNSQIESFVVSDPQSNTQQQVIADVYLEKDKTVFGGLVIIPSGEERDVVITWKTLIKDSPTSSTKQLAILWQKQAGTKEDSVSITVTVPGKNIVALPKALLTTNGLIEYNTTLGHDFMAQLIWQDK